MAKTPVVDSHHHFWNPAERAYPWMEGLTALQRPYGADDMRPLLEAAGVDYTVIVQTVSDLQETREFLQIAAETDFVAGVVGWVDLTNPDIDQTLRSLKDRPDGHYLVGIRHQVHDERDIDYLRRGSVQRGISAIGAAGLVYDLLLKPPYIDAAVACASALPDTRFVIDHIAKPNIAGHEIEPWASGMRALAGLPNVWVKVSGMIEEAGWTTWRPDDIRPYVEMVLEWFGPDRLIFGSNWPVCLVAGSYAQVYDVLSEALVGITERERSRIFGGNAIAAYRLAL